MDRDRIQNEAQKCYSQFVSSPPHRSSFLGGFEVGALWMEHEQEAELAALRERVKRLEGGLMLCIGMDTSTPWMYVRRQDVDAYCDRWAYLSNLQPPASPAVPDPLPLRTCLELLAQLGVEAQHLNRAGDNEALRAMAGRLTQAREGL